MKFNRQQRVLCIPCNATGGSDGFERSFFVVTSCSDQSKRSIVFNLRNKDGDNIKDLVTAVRCSDTKRKCVHTLRPEAGLRSGTQSCRRWHIWGSQRRWLRNSIWIAERADRVSSQLLIYITSGDCTEAPTLDWAFQLRWLSGMWILCCSTTLQIESLKHL